MISTPDFAAVAALVGDPTRGRMLTALMDGRARTATELALDGGVTPSTASSHLARLTAVGLLAVVPQGRHRYFRIASPDVAAMLEGLMGLAERHGLRARSTGPRDQALRRARVCYDHLAGEAGVRLHQRLRDEQLIGGHEEAPVLTARGEEWCERLRIDARASGSKRRPLCRACLDWSERRIHLGGALGSALLDRLFQLRYARRLPGSRAVALTPRGHAFVEHLR